MGTSGASAAVAVATVEDITAIVLAHAAGDLGRASPLHHLREWRRVCVLWCRLLDPVFWRCLAIDARRLADLVASRPLPPPPPPPPLLRPLPPPLSPSQYLLSHLPTPSTQSPEALSNSVAPFRASPLLWPLYVRELHLLHLDENGRWVRDPFPPGDENEILAVLPHLDTAFAWLRNLSTLHCHPRLRRRVLPLALRHCRRLRDLPDDGLGTPPLDAHNFVVMVAAAAKAACLDAGVPPDPPRTIRERGRIYDPLTDGAPAFFRHISTMLPLLADRPFLGMPARTPFLADARRLSIRGTVATTVLFAPPSLSQPQSFPSLRVLRLDLAGLSDWAVETFGALRPLDLGVTSLTIRAQPAAVVATLRHLPALRALVLPLQLDLADARVVAAAAPATIEYLAVADGSWLPGLAWLFPHLRHLKAKFDAGSVENYFSTDYRGASQVPFTPTLCSFESTFPGQAPDLSPATFALLASLEVLGPVSVGYGDGADAAAGLSAADLAALVQVVARLPRLRWVRVAVDEPPTLSTTSRSSRPTFALGNDKKASNAAADDDDAVWLWFLQYLYQKRHRQRADAPAATGSGNRRPKLVVQFNRRMSAAVWARAAALGIDLWPPEHWTWPSVAFEVGGDDDARSDKPCSQCSGLF